jgi:hypothetical protein
MHICEEHWSKGDVAAVQLECSQGVPQVSHPICSPSIRLVKTIKWKRLTFDDIANVGVPYIILILLLLCTHALCHYSQPGLP